MTTQFNKIETTANDSKIINKSAAYLSVCDEFEIAASEAAKNGGFIINKVAEEVSLAYDKAKKADCEYAIYRAALECEIWFSKLSAKSFSELMK